MLTSLSSPQAEVTPQEAAILIDWAKQDALSGTITQEQANKQFDQLGASPEQRAPDTRTNEQKALDQKFPPSKPEDYLIRYSRPGQDVPMTEEIKQFDQSARTWMSEAGLPRELGNSLVSTIEKVTERTQAMTPDQLEQYGFEEFQKLQKVYGNTLEDRLHQVALMVHDLEQKRPGLKQLLKAMGLETRLLLCHNSSRRRNAITRGRGAKRPPVLVDSGHAGPGNRPEKISLPFSLIF